MTTFNIKTLTLLVLPILTMPLSTSAIDLFGSDKEDVVIWEVNQNVYIKLSDQEKSAKVENDHPIELDKEDIRKSLTLLVVQQAEYSDTVEDPVLVFNQTEMNLLSNNLARAFAKAKPDQDIIFTLKKNKSRFLGLKSDQYFDAGRAFYKDNKLNIIIGDYDRAREEGYESVYDPTHVGIVKYNFDHGKRSKSAKKFKQAIVAVNGVETKDKKRPDWFVIDLKLASQTADLQIRNREKNELVSKRQELKRILGDDAVGGVSAQEQAKMSKERREMRAEMARMRKEMREMSTGGSGSGLEQRLSTLKELKNKGLISDKEYQFKRQEMLKDL